MLKQHIFLGFFCLLTGLALYPNIAQAKGGTSVDYVPDNTLYLQQDVEKAFPHAVILNEGDFKKNPTTQAYQLKDSKAYAKPPEEIFLKTTREWIEPVTPPTEPTSLDIGLDEMQIREPHGDVQIALPAAPDNFSPVQDKMVVPNGAIIKTGATSTVAILLGGVNSIRLTDGTQLSVFQSLTTGVRATTVNLSNGAVFAKVGLKEGEQQDFRIKTALGTAVVTAAGKGSEFLTVKNDSRMDVWIEKGYVELDDPNGGVVGALGGLDSGVLRSLSLPSSKDPSLTLTYDAQSLSQGLNIIPLVNQKTAALRARKAKGEILDPREVDYLGRIKFISVLTKLKRVDASPAPMLATNAPYTPPAPVPKMADMSATGTPSSSAPMSIIPPPEGPVTLTVYAEGKTDWNGQAYAFSDLEKKLNDLGKKSPQTSLTLQSVSDAPYTKIVRILAAIKAAGLKNLTVATDPFVPKPAPPTKIEINLSATGAITLNGQTVASPDQLTASLLKIQAATPNLPVMIHSQENTQFRFLAPIIEACKKANLPDPTFVQDGAEQKK